MAVLVLRVLLALGFALVAAPAFAQSDVNPAEIGRAFCAGLVAGDMTPLVPLLTPELAELTAGKTSRWASGTEAVVGCMPVGASGTVEHPEAVLFLQFADGKTASDKLVLSFVDANLRIEDVVFGEGGTLRETLAQ